MMGAYGNRLALVGLCTDRETPVGRWVERDFAAGRFWFYGVGRRAPSPRKPLVPGRLSQYLRLRRHRPGVLSLGVRSAFLQAPEELMAVSRWGLDSICYRFPGVENPLTMPRYRWGRLFAGWFDRQLFRALDRTDIILASADEKAIARLVARSRGRLRRDRIRAIPTQYDSGVFRPAPAAEARRKLRLELGGPLLVSSGRLNRVKGWELLLEAFRELLPGEPDARMVFVGDGEDRRALEKHAGRLGLAEKIRVTGFVAPSEVATWLNAADLVLVGSHLEGWSIAMLEALGCGKPLVSTDVSGARDMIREGENGFVVIGRDPARYAEAVRRALRLPEPRAVSLELAARYGVDAVRCVGQYWPVLA